MLTSSSSLLGPKLLLVAQLAYLCLQFGRPLPFRAQLDLKQFHRSLQCLDLIMVLQSLLLHCGGVFVIVRRRANLLFQLLELLAQFLQKRRGESREMRV